MTTIHLVKHEKSGFGHATYDGSRWSVRFIQNYSSPKIFARNAMQQGHLTYLGYITQD